MRKKEPFSKEAPRQKGAKPKFTHKDIEAYKNYLYILKEMRANIDSEIKDLERFLTTEITSQVNKINNKLLNI